MFLQQIPYYKIKKKHFETLTQLRTQEKVVQTMLRLSLFDEKFKKFLSFYLENYMNSKSRHLTDLVALYILGPNRKFLEIGAHDPINQSDTYLLEKFHGWKGVQIEPNSSDCEKIRSVRTSNVVCAAVINEAKISKKMYLDTELGKVSTKKTKNLVSLITLEDIANQFGSDFDALFIDVEGMESDIIKSETFAQFNFKFLSIERIWKSREIYSCMLRLGYINILGDISGYESWWVKEPIFQL